MTADFNSHLAQLESQPEDLWASPPSASSSMPNGNRGALARLFAFLRLRQALIMIVRPEPETCALQKDPSSVGRSLAVEAVGNARSVCDMSIELLDLARVKSTIRPYPDTSRVTLP